MPGKEGVKGSYLLGQELSVLQLLGVLVFQRLQLWLRVGNFPLHPLEVLRVELDLPLAVLYLLPEVGHDLVEIRDASLQRLGVRHFSHELLGRVPSLPCTQFDGEERAKGRSDKRLDGEKDDDDLSPSARQSHVIDARVLTHPKRLPQSKPSLLPASPLGIEPRSLRPSFRPRPRFGPVPMLSESGFVPPSGQAALGLSRFRCAPFRAACFELMKSSSFRNFLFRAQSTPPSWGKQARRRRILAKDV